MTYTPNSPRPKRQAIWALAALLSIGCAESEYVPVAGTVTWNGSPMPVGEVIFTPTDNRTSPTAGKIEQGEFAFPSKPGSMRVEIQAARETGKLHPVDGYKLTELYIPHKYNVKSELTAEVTRNGDNHFTFDLQE